MPMRRPNQMTRTELVEAMEDIQRLLYYDEDELQYDEDKEWEAGTIEEVADVLIRAGLRPCETEAPEEDKATGGFTQTFIEVEVLSEEPYEFLSLHALSEDSNIGECFSHVTNIAAISLTREEMADAVLSAGGDPKFFFRVSE